MDEEEPLCLKRFGYLPTKEGMESQRKVGRRKSERHYVKDNPGLYLTSREAQVSRLIASGFTIREAAKQVSLSPRTVEFYLSNIRRKLGVRNKNELIRFLHDNDFFK